MVASPVVGSLWTSVRGMTATPVVAGTDTDTRLGSGDRSPSSVPGVGIVTVIPAPPVFWTARKVPVPVAAVSPLAGAAAAVHSVDSTRPLSGETLVVYWAKAASYSVEYWADGD